MKVRFRYRKGISLAVACLLLAFLAACTGGGDSATATPQSTSGGSDSTTPPSNASAPSVASVSPANNATSVSIQSLITVTFDRSMDASSITTSTFIVTDNTGTQVSGSITPPDGNNRVIFTPGSLSSGTTYTVRLTTGIRSSAGVALATEYNWSFSTEVVNNSWTKQIGSTMYDGGVATAVDNSGNVYIVGNTWGSVDNVSLNQDASAETADIFVAKYNVAGTLQWVRQFGSNRADQATGIAVDTAGSVVVVGHTFGALPSCTNNGSSDYFIMKYNTNGTAAWSNAIEGGTTGTDEAWGVSIDRSGNIYIVGGSTGNIGGITNQGDYDAFVMKYAAAGGAPLWTRRLANSIEVLSDNTVYDSNPFRQIARAVAVDDDRDTLYITGESYMGYLLSDNATVVAHPDIFVDKVSMSTGSNLWGGVPYFFGLVDSDKYPQLDFGTGVAVDLAGDVYVSGYTVKDDKDHESNAGDVTFDLFKLTSSKLKMWHNYQPSGAHPGNEARAVAVDRLGNVYVAGYASIAMDEEEAYGGTDVVLMQFDGSTGATLWTRQYGTGGNERAFGVATDRQRQGNVYVIGDTNERMDGKVNAGGYDAFLLKYNPSGDRQ